jgi:hypothetical protein
MFGLTHKRRSTVSVPTGNVSYTHVLDDVDATMLLTKLPLLPLPMPEDGASYTAHFASILGVVTRIAEGVVPSWLVSSALDFAYLGIFPDRPGSWHK